MKVLLDNGTPRGVARLLPGHAVEEAGARGWEELANGELIAAAEDFGFNVIVTNDKNIQHQQNLMGRKLAIVALGNSQWPMVKLAAAEIAGAVDNASPGSYVEVPVPLRPRP